MRTGYQLAIAVAAVTLVAGVAVLLGELTSSSRDAGAYGEVPVPGESPVDLPQGEVTVFYGERASPGTPLAVPSELRLLVRSPETGLVVGSTPSLFGQFDDGDYVRRSVARLDVEEAGTYEARAESRLSGAVDPVITFGTSGGRNLEYPLFVLAGGSILALILAGGTWLRSRYASYE